MDKFDVVVVGAGPAGSIAAYLLAKEGLQVLLVERGTFPGSKNVSGGLLYSRIVNEIFPNFWEEAPVERAITAHSIVFLGEDSALALHYTDTGAANSPYNAFSVLRAKFDRWLAEKAEQAGATLIPGITVDGLLVEKGRIAGIKAGPDEIPADVVIDAEGAKSLLAKEAGLRGDFNPKDVSLGLKEVIELPEATINERFNCSPGEGAAFTMVGQSSGVEGGGFLYTNKTTLSLGFVAKISSLKDSQLKAHEIIEEYKSHPFISRLVQGGEVVEYSAQTVHRGGVHLIPQLYGDGILLVGSAAGLVLNNVLTLRGMDLAIASGVAAAKTVLAAKEKGDFSRAALSAYEKTLKENVVYRDLETFKQAYPLLENKRLFETYPDMLCSTMKELFSVDTTPRKKAFGVLREKMKGQVSMIEMAKDLVQVARGIGV
ncbi:MAG: FAD-dependent oxidoreductase [Chloroflexi bacterium]|nr:FAD-dependent oxidoreductase [Chloroflexota bacterium]